MKIPRSLPALSYRPIIGIWHRAILSTYYGTPLSSTHTRTTSGRFNGGTFAHPAHEALYFAEDITTAQFEVSELIGSPLPGGVIVPNPSKSAWIYLSCDVRLDAVVDFTIDHRGSALARFQTSVQELTGDWRGYQYRPEIHPALKAPDWTNVPTQKLGRILSLQSGIEGILTFSSKVQTRRNLVVFPQNLKPASRIRYIDPATSTVHQIP